MYFECSLFAKETKTYKVRKKGTNIRRKSILTNTLYDHPQDQPVLFDVRKMWCGSEIITANRTNFLSITMNMARGQTDVLPSQVQICGKKRAFQGQSAFLFGAITCFHEEPFLYRKSCYVQRFTNWVSQSFKFLQSFEPSNKCQDLPKINSNYYHCITI